MVTAGLGKMNWSYHRKKTDRMSGKKTLKMQRKCSKTGNWDPETALSAKAPKYLIRAQIGDQDLVFLQVHKSLNLFPKQNNVQRWRRLGGKVSPACAELRLLTQWTPQPSFSLEPSLWRQQQRELQEVVTLPDAARRSATANRRRVAPSCGNTEQTRLDEINCFWLICRNIFSVFSKTPRWSGPMIRRSLKDDHP